MTDKGATRKVFFINWLKNQAESSKELIEEISDTLSISSFFALKHKVAGKDFWEMDSPEEFEAVCKTLSKLYLFKALNREYASRLNKYAPYYKRFLESLKDAGNINVQSRDSGIIFEEISKFEVANEAEAALSNVETFNDRSKRTNVNPNPEETLLGGDDNDAMGKYLSFSDDADETQGVGGKSSLKYEDITIDHLGLSNRANHALKQANICTVDQLTALSAKSLMNLPKIGLTTAKELLNIQLKIKNREILPADTKDFVGKEIIFGNIDSLSMVGTAIPEIIGKSYSYIYFRNRDGQYKKHFIIEEGPFSERTTNSLRKGGFRFISEVAFTNYNKIANINNMGSVSLCELVEYFKKNTSVYHKLEKEISIEILEETETEIINSDAGTGIDLTIENCFTNQPDDSNNEESSTLPEKEMLNNAIEETEINTVPDENQEHPSKKYNPVGKSTKEMDDYHIKDIENKNFSSSDVDIDYKLRKDNDSNLIKKIEDYTNQNEDTISVIETIEKEELQTQNITTEEKSEYLNVVVTDVLTPVCDNDVEMAAEAYKIFDAYFNTGEDIILGKDENDILIGTAAVNPLDNEESKEENLTSMVEKNSEEAIELYVQDQLQQNIDKSEGICEIVTLTNSDLESDSENRENPSENQSLVSQKMEEIEHLKNNRILFIEWLKNKQAETGTIFGYLDAIKKCSQEVQRQHIAESELLLTTEAAELTKIHDQLIKSAGFKKLPSEQRQRFNAAFKALIKFRSQDKFSSMNDCQADGESENIVSTLERSDESKSKADEYSQDVNEIIGFQSIKETTAENHSSARQFSIRSFEGFLIYYGYLSQKEKTLLLFDDAEKYKKRMIRLCKKANKAMDKKYIGDITITEEEYALLKNYLYYAIPLLYKRSTIYEPSLFAVAVTQVAIRIYQEGNFWDYFFQEIGLSKNPAIQTAIGQAFITILKDKGKILIEENKYVQNILIHCFISNFYTKSYFEFLYDFYRIDLERDITLLDSEIINDLYASICDDNKSGRSYKLAQHVSQAFRNNIRGGKSRLRNHIKLLDHFYWDKDFQIKTKNRINSLLQDWSKTSGTFESHFYEDGILRRRGQKQFSAPTLQFVPSDDMGLLKIPAQSVKNYETTGFFWRISDRNNKTEAIHYVDAVESVIGYKVQPLSVDIPFESILHDFKLTLETNEEIVIKTFYFHQEPVKFFDRRGDLITAAAIKTGAVIAVSTSDYHIVSNGLIDTRIIKNMRVSYFQFNFEDMIRFPDGHAIIIGRKEIANGLTEKGRVANAVSHYEEKDYPLYGRIPYLLIRMQESKEAGTGIYINGVLYKLSEYGYEKFMINDKSKDIGYYIDLSKILPDKDDFYQIGIDIPGSIKHQWQFVYIRNFEADFDGKPYVFEPRGTVRFPEHIVIKNIEDYCEKEPGINAYKFIIENISRTLDFTTVLNQRDIDISIDVPAFYYKGADGQWLSNCPQPVWHTELPSKIELAVPYHKIELYMQYFSESGEETLIKREYLKTGQSDCINCDLTPFFSYFDDGTNLKKLYMRFDETDVLFLRIMLHNVMVSCNLIGDYKNNLIKISTEILGKAAVFADIKKDGQIMGEKMPLIDGKGELHCTIENVDYDVDIFESEEDDSGFGFEDYYKIGTYRQQLLNPQDMSRRSFKLIQIERCDNPEIIYQLSSYRYYVENLMKTDDIFEYSGTMTVEKNKGIVFAALPVIVRFEDLDNPSLAWIDFIDEYGDREAFLYDTKRHGILQEENENIPKLKCYRRYTLLDSEEELFRIEFCERPITDFSSIDEAIIFEEDFHGFSFVSGHIKQQYKPPKYIHDLSWKKEAFMLLDLYRTKYKTLDDLAKISKTEFMDATGATIEITNSIEKVMHFYEYAFRKVSRTGEN